MLGSSQCVSLNCVRMFLVDEIVPYHDEFGLEHWVTLDDDTRKGFTKEFVIEQLSYWMGKDVAENLRMKLSYVTLEMSPTFILKSLAGFNEKGALFPLQVSPAKSDGFCHNTWIHHVHHFIVRRIWSVQRQNPHRLDL